MLVLQPSYPDNSLLNLLDQVKKSLQKKAISDYNPSHGTLLLQGLEMKILLLLDSNFLPSEEINGSGDVADSM